MRHPHMLLAWVVLALGARAAAEDPPPPSQALASDQASPFARFGGALGTRAPFDRSYGVVVAYAPARYLETELRLAMREDRGVELAVGMGLRPMGRPFEGPVLRVAVVGIFLDQGAPSASGLRTDLDGGYALRIDAMFLEATVGASYRLRGPYVDESAWALAFGFRAGVAY